MSVLLPLEIQNPKKYGELDEQQLYLLCKQGALDLLLLENASELFKNLMFDTKGLLEYILQEISKGTDTKVIASLSFKISDVDVDVHSKEFLDETAKLAEAISKVKTRFVITIISLVHEKEDAHYGAFIYDKKTHDVDMFDSMMYRKKGDKEMTSGYSILFDIIADELFPLGNVISPSCIRAQHALQYTGGFPTNYAFYLKLANTKGLITYENMYDFNLQSTESQNHFCYMWAIWYIHLKLSGGNLKYYKEYIEDKDPLIIIKTYCYALLYNIYLKKKPLIDYIGLSDPTERQFFDHNFPAIWTQNRDITQPFKRREIVTDIDIQSGNLSMSSILTASLMGSKTDKGPSSLALLTNPETRILKQICESISAQVGIKKEEEEKLNYIRRRMISRQQRPQISYMEESEIH